MKVKKVELGLKENRNQFVLLVIINAFVGGMIGLERSILPRIAEVEFHIAAETAILSFIIVFGIVKAITNYFAGGTDRGYCGLIGYKPICPRNRITYYFFSNSDPLPDEMQR